ncbi:hypothetical protein [uncultured Lacticaseibacillus sp.]|uniref:hypothetical protein n=1 Tax=uncultured Lacticaseibacillus sp. TaxID=2775882 RepID=UPI00258431C9|nr:hypothetical protein [uncultured Lacticaseibacillus sp.]
MSNETKRNVFGQLLNAYQNLIMKDIEIPDGNYRANITTPWNIVYDAALPDDLPVIPKMVGEYIQERKAAHDSLAFALTARFIPNEVFEWMFMVTGDPDTELSQIEYVKQQNTFARAWVLGVWRVEETGEIVKLEAEK